MMEILLIVSATIISLVGIAGSLLPAIPGAPLNFAALIFLYFIHRGDNPSAWAMIIFGVLTALSLITDYVLPARSVKNHGATKIGIAGAIIGLAVGFIVFNFIGMFIGTFLGALAGEMLAGKEIKQAAKASLAGISGNILAITFKLILSLGMLVYFFIKLL